MSKIAFLKGLEILDSRGRPTVKAYCQLQGGAMATASVPSGASTGAAEAHELRDGEPERYGGKGCRKAAAHVGGEIRRALAGRNFDSQQELDRALIELDGTASKSRLGANALLAVSIAFARARAEEARQPLYRHFAEMLGHPLERFPRLTINLFSGGLHAGRQLPIQDVLMVPSSAPTYADGLAMAQRVYMAAVELTRRKYGMRWLTADEGGLAPPAAGAEALIEDAMQAIHDASLTPGKDVALAIDVASSHFQTPEGRYALGEERLTSSQMIERLAQWVERYPIVSIEDGLGEDDWDHWPRLLAALRDRALVLGDDLLCTNPVRIRKAIVENACNALLLKVNQIGTLSEALEAYRLARSAGWNITISARSGETEDNWYADLVVGWSGDQTKAGSITQSERLAKYNHLLEIEQELPLPMNPWPAPSAMRTK